MKCKSCEIDLNNPPASSNKVKGFSYPSNIPVSKNMKDTIDGIRRAQNARSSKSGRQK